MRTLPWLLVAVSVAIPSAAQNTAQTEGGHGFIAAASSLGAPQNIVASTISSSEVNVTWDSVTGAMRYDVYRSNGGGEFVKVAMPTSNSYPDTALPSDTSYLYQVRGVDFSFNPGPLSRIALATTTVFTDDPLVVGSTIVRAVHVTQSRTAVNAVRAAAKLSSFSFADSSVDGVAVRSAHVIDLRSALNEALAKLVVPVLAPVYSAAVGTPIHATDLSEIRGHVSGVTSSDAPDTFCQSGPPAQRFSTSMQGCAASVMFASRAAVCLAGYHVCSANEWVANRNGITPTHHYWTNDALRYGTSGMTNNCLVSLATSGTTACTLPAQMLVCSPAGDAPNTCAWVGCGFNSTSPNQWFGGCSGNTAGSLCCADSAFFVAAAGGSDFNPGTAAAPFKTITHALSVAGAGQQVSVAPGVYDVINGETFPLHVPSGVALIGNEAGKGSSPLTIITGCSGSPAATVIPGASSTIAGFTITCTSSGSAILANANGSVIRNNTLTGSGGFGINVINNSTNQWILFNMISQNTYGIYYQSGGVGGKAENNVITQNALYGVVYAVAGGDLGGGAAGSAGGNVISCNSNADLYSIVSGTISATNNKWDHVPLTSGTVAATGGVDLFSPSAATTFDTTGASTAPTPCP